MIRNLESKRRFKGTIISFLLFIIIIASISVVSIGHLSNPTNINSLAKKSVKTSSYTQHSPIEITQNSDFETLGFQGRGILSDPYIIEDLEISPSSSISKAISIQRTTCHFVIKNCVINCYGSPNSVGISLYRVKAGTASIIDNTVISPQLFGIGVQMSDSVLIKLNNVTLSFFFGLYLYDSKDMNVCNNTLVSNGDGIAFINTNSSSFYYNLFQENSVAGVVLSSRCNNNVFHHNDFIHSDTSVDLAKDDGFDNLWYDTSTNEGNYWSNWGSGDYYIKGDASAKDPYPLEDPVVGGVAEPPTRDKVVFPLVSILFSVVVMATVYLLKKRI